MAVVDFVTAPGLDRVTRGTTNPNRLRRMDRWLATALAQAPDLIGRRSGDGSGPDPIVIDLGFGAAPTTVLELSDRLRQVRPGIRVVGVEIDPVRVAAAQGAADPPRVQFVRGGFAADLPPGLDGPVVAIRAANVLRQYQEPEVAAAWSMMLGRLAPGGILQEGTCDELGRLCSWVTLRRDHRQATDAPAGPAGPEQTHQPEPVSLTLAWRWSHLDPPSRIAERLPKALIHRNVPGEGVHRLLGALDRAWQHQAALAPYGSRQRWLATVRQVRGAGWPVLDGPRRWRLGELTVPWRVVAPGPGEEPERPAQALRP